MVVGVVTHCLQVVMLTTDTQALLRVRHTSIFDRVVTQDDVLKLIHACIGKHQCRVVFDYHRSTRYNMVPLRCHKIQEGLSDFFTCHIFCSLLIQYAPLLSKEGQGWFSLPVPSYRQHRAMRLAPHHIRLRLIEMCEDGRS